MRYGTRYYQAAFKVRKDSWTVQIYLGRDPITGKKRYHSEAVKGTKAQAERRRTELQREVDTGTYADPSPLTVADYLREWMDGNTKVKPRTLEGYRGNVERYIIPRIGSVPVERLSGRQIDDMETWLLIKGGKHGQGLSNNTVRQVHKILSKALKDGRKLKKFSRKVLDEVEVVDPPKETQYEAGTLAWEDLSNFLDTVKDLQYRTCFLLAVQTGLRRSELSGLQWQDVDFQDGSLSVRRARVKLPSGAVSTSTPKSGRGRSIILPPQSIEALTNHRDRQGNPSGNSNFVFCNSDGRPLDPNQITKTFKAVATTAGFANLRLHDLRHTHASLLLKEDVNLKVTSERLGHSSVAITANLYSHVLPTVQRGAAHRFGDAWSAMEDQEKSRNGKFAEYGNRAADFIAN